MRRTLVTAAAAALTASLAFAALPAAADTNSDTIRGNDLTGVTDLGVDISNVGGDSASVHHYLTSLSPETRRAVMGGCETALADQANVAPTVIPFCQSALHG